ncbi:hypothetical protein [Streptomyces cremeus]
MRSILGGRRWGDAGWQRYLRLVQNHLEHGGSMPMEAGEVVVQGEDLGR